MSSAHVMDVKEKLNWLMPDCCQDNQGDSDRGGIPDILSERCLLLVPNGSLEKAVDQLLANAGISITYASSRCYYGDIVDAEGILDFPQFAVKLRPQDAPRLVASKKAELAFAGNDLIQESGFADELTILERFPISCNGNGQTRLVVAVPEISRIQSIDELKELKHRQKVITVATEYPKIAADWFAGQGVEVQITECDGACEAHAGFSDMILENVDTGKSLEANGLREIAEVMTSQLCLFTCRKTLTGVVGERIDQIAARLRKVIL